MTDLARVPAIPFAPVPGARGAPFRFVPARQTHPRLALTTLTVAMWLGVLAQKIAVPGNVEITLPILLGAIAFLMAVGRARMSLPRLMVFALLGLAVAVGQAVAADYRNISVPALAMAIAIYGMFLFVVPLKDEERTLLLARFQGLALFIAAMVAVQWAFQLAGLPMPTLEMLIPPSMLFDSYNSVQPLAWKAAYMKPNGIFMLEASHTSQLLAMAVVIEVCTFRRWGRVAALLVAQLSTFGGTGFILLLASGLLLPFHLRGRNLAILAGITLLVAVGTSFTPVWTNFAKRSAEIGAEDTSSGRGRFVEPYLFMVDRLSSDQRTLVSGLGPGNGKLDRDRTGQLVMNPLVKATVEYGLIAGILWMLFIHGCVLRTRMPFAAAFVVIIQYDFLNGSLLVPIHLLYCWVLAGAHARGLTDTSPPQPLPHHPLQGRDRP
jgi:hypothetical protein